MVARYHIVGRDLTFDRPNVLDFTPKLGPKSGGTIVALHGEYVNAGRIIEAYFSGSSCLINRTVDAFNETLVFCNTTSTNVTDSAKLSMYFDGTERLAPESKKFAFTEDPTVTDIYPSTSMISGGRRINVTGTYLTSIRQPRMLITAGRPFVSEQPCDVRSFSEMDCITPPVDISVPLRNNRNSGDDEVTVGFIMDAVQEVRQLDFDFEIVVDPEYYPFPEEGNIREHQGGQLVVRGKNLNLASTESEVMVTIGQEECRVVSLADVQLNCISPVDEPKGVNKSGSPTENGLPVVIVEIGNLEFFIGYLKYPIISPAISSGLIGGLVAAFVLLVAITIVIVIVCYLRNRKLDRQIAETENRLQTMVMEMRAGPDVNLPFADYSKYTANMVYDLRTGQQGLENLHSNTNRKMDLEKFNSLLMNKFFCLVLIRTLEQQRRMANDQKKAFGHLLTIALHEKTKIYLPEILKELFADAVIKAERTKKTKSMLNRVDTIMESILNAWFAITLYSYIKTCLGESIYELFLAMTTQADKEPRQMLTGSTRDKVHTVFANMLTLDEQHHSHFPAPIKFMFDMLDSIAEKHGISDGNVTRSWKCDSLHLGLWAKILQSPQYVLDIKPTNDVKRGLEGVAQAFIEICSETTNSPSETDELYEEISTFKTQLQQFFDDIKALPSVSEGALKQYLEEHSQDHSASSDRLAALDELIKFVIGFHNEITEALQNDENCEKEGHAVALKELISSIVESQYEQIPGKYESLQPRPVVLYDGLHQLPQNPPQYQDLYPEQRSKYMMLQRHKEERPEEASSQHTPSEYQSIQPEPKSQYTHLKFN
ncbi:plexin-A4-like [Ptychodera flava]|uniref:plexin-A4-like n=1 Tax=Ptychodera flava TaxID=63121 RepID=UPI00396A0391